MLEIIIVTPSLVQSTPPPNPLVAVGASAIDNSGHKTIRPLGIFQSKNFIGYHETTLKTEQP